MTWPALGNGFREHPRSLHRKRYHVCGGRFKNIIKIIKIESINPRTQYKWQKQKKILETQELFPLWTAASIETRSFLLRLGTSPLRPLPQPLFDTPPLLQKQAGKNWENVQSRKFDWLVFKSGFGPVASLAPGQGPVFRKIRPRSRAKKRERT